MNTGKIARRGFTSAEFITVAGCVALLLAIFVPAILHAREEARGQLCQDRMKKILLALHNYHDAFQMFPAGWISRSRDGDSQPGFGWMASLLPYLDQTPIYQRIKIEELLARPDETTSTALECYQCPADASFPAMNAFRGGYGASSYSGNIGNIAPIRWSDGRIESYWPGAVPTFSFGRHHAGRPATGMDYVHNGLFGCNTGVRISSITDGTSNTLAIGERSRISGWSIWAGVGANRFENDAVTDVSYGSPMNKSLTGYSSAHPGGVYVGLVDGNVRFLSNSVDSKPQRGVLQMLGSRSDGEMIPRGALTEF